MTPPSLPAQEGIFEIPYFLCLINSAKLHLLTFAKNQRPENEATKAGYLLKSVAGKLVGSIMRSSKRCFFRSTV